MTHGLNQLYVLMDRSPSMWKHISVRKRRIDLAVNLLEELAEEIMNRNPNSLLRLSLYIFPSKTPGLYAEYIGSKILASKLYAKSLLKRLNMWLEPVPTTPLFKALEELATMAQRSSKILTLSDGEEIIGSPTSSLYESIRSKNLKIVFIVINNYLPSKLLALKTKARELRLYTAGTAAAISDERRKELVKELATWVIEEP